MSDRDNPISVRSKRHITDALLSLMQDEPFSKISIKEIVDEAHLTRQTFYHNFDSKEDVLLLHADELFQEFMQHLVDNNISKWQDVLWFYFRYWQRNSDFVELLIKNNLVYIMEARLPGYFKVIQETHMKDVGLTDTEAEFVYSFISGAVVNMLVSWIRGGQVLTTREMAALAIQLIDGTLYGRTSAGETKKTRT